MAFDVREVSTTSPARERTERRPSVREMAPESQIHLFGERAKPTARPAQLEFCEHVQTSVVAGDGVEDGPVDIFPGGCSLTIVRRANGPAGRQTSRRAPASSIAVVHGAVPKMTQKGNNDRGPRPHFFSCFKPPRWLRSRRSRTCRPRTAVRGSGAASASRSSSFSASVFFAVLPLKKE